MIKKTFAAKLGGGLLALLLGFQSTAVLAAGDKTNHFGQYRELLAKIKCPHEYQDPAKKYVVYGYTEAPDGYYCDQKVPTKGYWVYLYPDWYIWGKEDLAGAGMERVSQAFQFSKRSVTLEMAYFPPHRAWAETNLARVAETIKDLERLTGKPYPGVNPYRIEESREIEATGVTGTASNLNMRVSPPGVSTTWTLLHETVHIWNSVSAPAWAGEGLPDVISWLLMYENRFPFSKDETLQTYLDEWYDVMETKDDAPMVGHYEDLPQGKAMQFWLMIYELYGPDFLYKVFVASHQDSNFTLAEFKKLLAEVTDQDPEKLFSGWLSKGPYHVYEAKDFGKVRFALPDGYQL